MSLGNNIRSVREQFGLSQSEFADRLFVTQQAVDKWEKDKSIPQFDKVLDVCRIFDVALSSVCCNTLYESDSCVIEDDLTDMMQSIVCMLEKEKGCNDNKRLDYVLWYIKSKWLQSDGRYVFKFVVNAQEYDLWKSLKIFDANYDVMDFFEIIDSLRFRKLIAKSHN